MRRRFPTPLVRRSLQWSRITWRRQIYRRGRWRGRARTARSLLAFLGGCYTAFFSFVTFYAAFWIVLVVLNQLSDLKKDAITLFPAGLTDATTLLPLTLLAFSGLLFAAQGSVKEDSTLHGVYGYAGRAFLNAFYFLTLSLVLGLGERIVHPDTFDKVRAFGALLHWLATLMPALLNLSGIVAGLFALMGVLAFCRSLTEHTT